jgi:hypothetical protein
LKAHSLQLLPDDVRRARRGIGIDYDNHKIRTFDERDADTGQGPADIQQNQVAAML